MIKKFLPYSLLLFVTLVLYRYWFTSSLITGGDFPLYFPFAPFSFPFLYGWGNGISSITGSFMGPFLWGSTLFIPIFSFLGSLDLPWWLIERIGLLFPYLIFSTLFTFFGFRRVLRDPYQNVFACFIYLFNSFVLMWVGGGLVVLAMSYSMLPLIFFIFKENIQLAVVKKNRLLLLGVLLGIQALLDIRISIITFLLLTSYFIFLLYFSHEKIILLKKMLVLLIWAGAITLLLNAVWVLPTLLVGRSPFSSLDLSYQSKNTLDFLSFGKLENGISLLSPYFPENVFGKVPFFNPAFLILPILAFSALIFVRKHAEKKFILFLASVAIVGIFLLKGNNPPFGFIYTFLYLKFPGFSLFRDSMKWFVLVAFSFSILAPYALEELSGIFRKKNLRPIFYLLFFSYLIFLLKPLILDGTKLFKPTSLPNSYVQFRDFIQKQNSYFRIAWFPSPHQFSYVGDINPAADLRKILPDGYQNNPTILTSRKQEIENLSVKYIVVPEDLDGQVFSKDYKYDQTQYEEALLYLKSIPWLKQAKTIGKITVFEVNDYKSHFYVDSTNARLTNYFINPSTYEVMLNGLKKGDTIIFTETYDPAWTGKSNNTVINSVRWGRYNSFKLVKNGENQLEVYYKPQDFVNLGLVISISSLIISAILLLFLNKIKIREILR